MCRHTYSNYACGHKDMHSERCEHNQSPLSIISCDYYTTIVSASVTLCASFDSFSYCKDSPYGSAMHTLVGQHHSHVTGITKVLSELKQAHSEATALYHLMGQTPPLPGTAAAQTLHAVILRGRQLNVELRLLTRLAQRSKQPIEMLKVRLVNAGVCRLNGDSSHVPVFDGRGITTTVPPVYHPRSIAKTRGPARRTKASQLPEQQNGREKLTKALLVRNLQRDSPVVRHAKTDSGTRRSKRLAGKRQVKYNEDDSPSPPPDGQTNRVEERAGAVQGLPQSTGVGSPTSQGIAQTTYDVATIDRRQQSLAARHLLPYPTGVASQSSLNSPSPGGPHVVARLSAPQQLDFAIYMRRELVQTQRSKRVAAIANPDNSPDKRKRVRLRMDSFRA